MLVEKIVVENARYARILGFEQQELSRRYAFFSAAVDRVGHDFNQPRLVPCH
jgi:hypothetical protein